MNKKQAIQTYVQEASKLRDRLPQQMNLWSLIRFFPAWHRSLASNANPLSDRSPWITFAAIAFLERTLTKDMQVYEYGVGGSTLFFSSRVKEVVSCEHDPGWAAKVRSELERLCYTNCHLQTFEPTPINSMTEGDPSDLDAYLSHSPAYKHFCFKDYVQSIDSYPDNFFDVILIDGRSRPSCCKHAVKKVKVGGYIILDNAERACYAPAQKFLQRQGFVKIDFYGPGPYNAYFWQTCVWRKL